MIKFRNPENDLELQYSSEGLKDGNRVVFPQKSGAIRLVVDDNYTSSFGFQWNKFAKTQIDREVSSSAQSKERFFAATGWDKMDLTGINVLEVGSGAGRFSQIILDHTKANLYSIDYSNAVEANFKNNGHHGDRFKLFQASVYDMPFVKGQFDKVICFGVLQHTPDVKKSVACLAEMVKPGGELIVDFYPITGWYTKIHAKYLMRPITKKMDYSKLLNKIEHNIDWMIRASKIFNKLKVGKLTNRFIPICDIKSTMPAGLNASELREWCVLDTFDMFSPQFDQPQKIATVKKWFEDLGFEQIFADYVPYGDGNRIALVKGVKK